MIGHAEMLRLKRLNTPTIYNGWEAYTKHDRLGGFFNVEETRDFMPQMGPMVGRAVTVVIKPTDKKHQEEHPDIWRAYREHVAGQPGPKVIVIQDLDKPYVIGSFWGEVNSNAHRALGCVGTITDGAIRDVDEMTNAGFKALARRLCVAHAYVAPIRWGCEVEVFGTKVKPGQLIHADKHGFMVIPQEDEDVLVNMARFMDDNEMSTVIPASRGASGMPYGEVIDRLSRAGDQFADNLRAHVPNAKGEW